MIEMAYKLDDYTSLEELVQNIPDGYVCVCVCVLVIGVYE
jgi:hypothetical protein